MEQIATTLVDSDLWIDLVRAKSPRHLKDFVAKVLFQPGIVLADPIRFEVLAFASKAEVAQIRELFDIFPIAKTPPNLWDQAIDLGRQCSSQGHSPGRVDLLIAAVAVIHDLELLTFDTGMSAIAKFSPLRVLHLIKPVAPKE